jgi:hypothetical protein
MTTMHYVTAALAVALVALGVMFVAYRLRIDRLVQEGNRRIEDALGNPLLTGINIGNGSLDIGMEEPGPQLIAGMFLGMFEKYPDAKNYIEAHLSSSKGDVIVTARRRDGKTPDAMRREAEQKLAVVEVLIRTAVASLEAELDAGWSPDARSAVRRLRTWVNMIGVGVDGRCIRVGEPCECAPEAKQGCVSWRAYGERKHG